jgi:hypothetical protein
LNQDNVPRPSPLATLLITLLVGVVALWPSAVWAQDAPPQDAPPQNTEPFGTIVVVTEQDDAGRWRTVSPSSMAVRERDGVELPVQPDMPLALGDRLRTDLARVEVRLATGERLNLSEGTTITLDGERSLLQELGEVYYRMRSAFRVQYGTVETVVEGTRFVVLGDGEPGSGAVRVRVDEGLVRVSNGDTQVQLPRGQEAVLPGSGPALMPPTRARPTPAQIARTFPQGRPRLVLGAMAVADALIAVDDPPADISALRLSEGLRLSAAVGLGRVLRLGYDTTLNKAGQRGVRLPQELSLAVALPGTGLAFGGGPSVTWEQRTKQCQARTRLLHIGGSGWVRGSLPLGRRLALTAEARAGYADMLQLGGGAGVEVGL